MKRYFFLSHKKSSALVVSVVIHAVFIAVALTFVAVQVYVKPEQTFEVKEVKRPQMKLRKLQVPVKQKKAQAPKLRKTIVAKPKTTIDIKMPEIVGVKGGMGYGQGGGLGSLGFGLDMDLFGGEQGFGNELIGTFYDLKRDANGDPLKYGVPEYIKTIRGFVGRGWKEHILQQYYHVPKKKYAIALSMPTMGAEAAPEAFGVANEIEPSYWVIHYKGEFNAPEDGTYRFCGAGDNVLIVKVGKDVVLDGSLPHSGGKYTTRGVISAGWESRDANHGKYPLNNIPMAIGDWIPMQKGQRMPIEVLVGEIPGKYFSCQLLIEKQGETYRKVVSKAGGAGTGFTWEGGTRPVLPIFKLAAVQDELAKMMKINPDEASLDGPTFGVLSSSP